MLKGGSGGGRGTFRGNCEGEDVGGKLRDGGGGGGSSPLLKLFLEFFKASIRDLISMSFGLGAFLLIYS